MDNLGIEDLKQLVNFYKQRAVELEFTVLQNQLLIPRVTKEKENLQSANISLQSRIDALVAENNSLKEQANSKKKKTSTKKTR